jgi:hypothetical protein
MGRCLLTIVAAKMLSGFDVALAGPVFATVPLISHISRYLKTLALMWPRPRDAPSVKEMPFALFSRSVTVESLVIRRSVSEETQL